MDRQAGELRRKVADAAEALLAGSVSYREFVDQFPGDRDEDMSDLFDLVEHIPRPGGLLGASQQRYRAHIARIVDAIRRLRIA